MIVALPVCTKDEHLAVLGLRVARKLDASVPFECVIVHERGHDVSAITDLAKGYFKDVSTLMYEPCPYGKEFPKPHNWAWQHTARFMATQNKPWLWWEPDACPTKSGWLTTLATAYKEGRKPFAGPIERNNRRPYLVGVAIYPHNAAVRCENAMITRQGPFDQVLSWLDNAVGQSLDIGHLLYHDFRPDGTGRAWYTLGSLPDTVVLWHRCEDGSLHKLLLGAPDPEPEPIIVDDTCDVTVVITNFKRPDQLHACFNSCMAAEVPHLVISSSGADSILRSEHTRIKHLLPSVVIDSITDDRGCNEMWLRGVRHVKTRRTMILHDDDWLLPNFREILAGKYREADVIHWDGAKHLNGTPFPGEYVTRPDLPAGLHPIGYLLPFLLVPLAHTISPVGGLFPTTHVVDVLTECEKKFKKDPAFFTRPNMMVGNDIMLWLRACERYRTVYYSHTPYISYGHWSGSESFTDSSTQGMKLVPCYQAARHYWLNHSRRIQHVLTRYPITNTDARARYNLAESTWELGYDRGLVVPVQVWNAKRTSWSIRDKLATHFLKDVLQAGLDAAGPKDYICLTNDDTMINQYWWYHAYSMMHDQGAVCSFRRNLKPGQGQSMDCYPITQAGELHVGRDAFMFRRDWLEQYMPEIPDYVLGYGDWDSTMAMLIRISNGNQPKASEFTQEHPASEVPSKFIYHVDHTSFWSQAGIKEPGNAHNRKLTQEFFKKHLGWEMPHLRGEW